MEKYNIIKIVLKFIKSQYNHDFAKGSFFSIFLFYSYRTYLQQYKRFTLLDLLRHLPILNKTVDNKIEQAKQDIGVTVNSNNIKYMKALPSEGLEETAIISKISEMKSVKWDNGMVSGVVYHGGEEYKKFLMRVFGQFAWTNPLHFDLFPKIRNMEIEIVKMAGNMFQGDELVMGNVTYGGTESLLLACKTYRDWGFHEKNISNPNIVILESGHSAFKKAGHYFKIDIRTVPIDKKTGTTTIDKIKKYVDRNTVCIVGSGPGYAHGIIDPIEDIATFAKNKNIGVHVDCCMGGFLLPFLRDKIEDKFDFSVPGITSISADTHKYGYAFKGSSIILYKNLQLKKYQHFSHTDWNGGIYATPTIMGSKSGALIATAWAAMLYHGQNKYQTIALKIMESTEKIVNAVNLMEYIDIIGNPKINIIAFTSKVIDIYKLSSCLSDKGWHLNILQNPPSFHFCITHMHIEKLDIIDKFIIDLKISINEVKENKYKKIAGTAALYGMASSINQESITQEIIDTYINLLSTDNVI